VSLARVAVSLLRREGLFSVQTSVGADDTLAALHEIHRELRLLTQKPVSGPELAKAKELVIETLPAQAETLEGLVEAHSVLTAHDLPLGSLAQLPQEVASVTAGRLRELASQMLHPDQTTVVVVGDLNRLAEPLQRAYGRAVLLDADGQPA
jgi:predicted Zn-dependent peptidase